MAQFHNGTVILLEVYSPDGELIGHGYMLCHAVFGVEPPVLSDSNGDMLPESWYGLKAISNHPTVWNDTEH